jgi:hypothetical protein
MNNDRERERKGGVCVRQGQRRDRILAQNGIAHAPLWATGAVEEKGRLIELRFLAPV